MEPTSSPGTEELGHLEMIGAIVHQLTRNLTEDQIKTSGFAPYFVDHTTGIYPTAASGAPWNAAGIGVKGDVIADLTENMAAEQKARVTYDNILRLSDDPDVSNVIKFLRAREIVHFQRFGEAKRTGGTKKFPGPTHRPRESIQRDRTAASICCSAFVSVDLGQARFMRRKRSPSRPNSYPGLRATPALLIIKCSSAIPL